MNDLIVKIEKVTRKVELEQTYIGNDHENLQEKLVFQFDTFVNGQGRLEYKINGTKNYIVLTKEDETYTIPVQNVITIYQSDTVGKIEFQLVVTEGTVEENIPVFKSNIFYLKCRPSINAVNEAPEGYDLWIEQANAKLNLIDAALEEVDNLDIDVSKSGTVATVTITKKDGTSESEEINDGEPGPANTLTIGTVEKGDEADATITGTSPNQILNLVLPKGDKGDKGSTGDTGDTGPAGPANTLSIGTVTSGQTASATITGDSPNQTLSLVLPKGDKGDKGNTGSTGATGPANTLTIGTVTKGSDASASITGDAPNQTLNLVLPKGDKGDTGSTGQTGATGQDGYSPTATVTKSGSTATITITDKNGTTTASISDGSAGTMDYTDLENKPQINSVTLSGNKSLSDLGVQPAGNYLTSETDPVFSASASANITSSDISNWNNKGTYSKPSGGIPSTDLSSEVQTSLGKADTALQSISSSDVTTALGYTPYNSSNPNGYTSNTGTITSVKMNGSTIASSGEADLGTVITQHQDISGKQNITDNTLTTTNKTVPSAINEVNSIAKGANQALSYSNYSSMVTAFNSLDDDVYNVGQNVMIVTLEVPDLWISSIESTSSTYTYVDDATIVSALQTNGYIQVGYYKLSMLETQKVDLTNYVTNTDYATNSTAGIVKVGNGLLLNDSNAIYGETRTYSNYTSVNNGLILCKGTLENVITGKSLETATNKVASATGLSSSSTDTQYPSAKCVYDYIQSLDATEVAY